jgi:NAD(P)-dependent dehydrogenase (short-subunit alcohol dehydrogenase family)
MLRTFSGRTAVITGAASGIGLALTEACLDEGMAVAMVDLPGERLDAAVQSVAARGLVHAYGLDVADVGAFQAAAEAIRNTFGPVHLLCNNAGIAGLHRWFWKFSDAEWRTMIYVNLRGVINGLQVFLPAMLDQAEGHVVNTASMAGLVPTPMNAPYCATKFGVVGLTETLALDLAQYGSKIGVSVLCPGMVATSIVAKVEKTDQPTLDADERGYNDNLFASLDAALKPAEAAQTVLDGVRQGRFHILTHPSAMTLVDRRFEAIQAGWPPPLPH